MFHVLGVKSRDICQIFTSCPVDLEYETHHVVQSRIILVGRNMWWVRRRGEGGGELHAYSFFFIISK